MPRSRSRSSSRSRRHRSRSPRRGHHRKHSPSRQSRHDSPTAHNIVERTRHRSRSRSRSIRRRQSTSPSVDRKKEYARQHESRDLRHDRHRDHPRASTHKETVSPPPRRSPLPHLNATAGASSAAIHHDAEGRSSNKNSEPVTESKKQPNYGLSGALAASENTHAGIVLKYAEPASARKPDRKYRLYVFKQDKQVDMLHVHRQSAYLFGRERLVADIPIDHPSCSKQHAVLQYRMVESDVRPYLIDLESANKTFINGIPLPSARYVELKHKDVIKFAQSTREYVFVDENALD